MINNIADELWGQWKCQLDTGGSAQPILRRAAEEIERLREVCEMVIAADKWPRPLGAPSAEQLIIKCAEMARTVMANCDDHELADPDWLNGLRRKGGNMSILRIQLVGSEIRLMSPCSLPTEGIEGLRDYVSPRPATKGDVRRLCRALGVELIEPQQACF